MRKKNWIALEEEYSDMMKSVTKQLFKRYEEEQWSRMYDVKRRDGYDN